MILQVVMLMPSSNSFKKEKVLRFTIHGLEDLLCPKVIYGVKNHISLMPLNGMESAMRWIARMNLD